MVSSSAVNWKLKLFSSPSLLSKQNVSPFVINLVLSLYSCSQLWSVVNVLTLNWSFSLEFEQNQLAFKYLINFW